MRRKAFSVKRKKLPVYKTWQMYYFEAKGNLFWIAFMNSKYFFLLNSIFDIILACIFPTLTFCLVPRSITRTDKGYCSKSIPRQVWTKQQHAKIHLRHWQCPYQVFYLGHRQFCSYTYMVKEQAWRPPFIDKGSRQKNYLKSVNPHTPR